MQVEYYKLEREIAALYAEIQRKRTEMEEIERALYYAREKVKE